MPRQIAPTPSSSTIASPGPGDRVLLFAPHPDDESIGAGGLLAAAGRAGATVRIVIATSGENNPWAQRAFERRVILLTRHRLRFAARREAEVLAAVRELGLAGESVLFLRFPDQGLTQLLLRDAAFFVSRLGTEIERFAPTIVLTPAAVDLHPDHSALAVACELALARSEGAHPPPRRLAFIVHNRSARHAPLPALHLDDADARAKRAAITRHESQLVLRGGFLRSLAAKAEPYSLVAIPPPGPPHPIESARWERGKLVLGLRPRGTVRAFGPATLRLLPAGATRAALSIPLPRHRGRVELTTYTTGLAVGQGEIRRAGSHLEIVLPGRLVAGDHTLFAKLERRWGFFDEAGWVRLDRPRDGGANGEVAAGDDGPGALDGGSAEVLRG